jgi:hypothetical protein
VIVALCGLFDKDQVLNHAIEFTGSGLESLSIDDRLTVFPPPSFSFLSPGKELTIMAPLVTDSELDCWNDY